MQLLHTCTQVALQRLPVCIQATHLLPLRIQVTLSSGNISGNRAASGGAIAGYGYSAVITAPGQVLVQQNLAETSGGGLLLAENATASVLSKVAGGSLYLPGATKIAAVEASADSLASVFVSNTAPSNADVAVTPTTFALLSNATVNDYVNQYGADDSVLWAVLKLTGYLNLPVQGVPLEAALSGAVASLAAANTDEDGVVRLGLRLA